MSLEDSKMADQEDQSQVSSQEREAPIEQIRQYNTKRLMYMYN